VAIQSCSNSQKNRKKLVFSFRSNIIIVLEDYAMPKVAPRSRDLFDWIILASMFIGIVTGLVFWVTDTSKEESATAATKVEERIVGKIETVVTVVEMKNEEVQKTIEKLDESVGIVHKRIGETNKKVDDVKGKMHSIDVKQTRIDTKLDSVDNRLGKVEDKIDI